MTNGSIQQKDIIIVNMYAPLMGASKYIKQVLMDRREKSTVIWS